MKKINAFLLMFFSLLALISFAHVEAAVGDIYEIGGAKYYAQEIVESTKMSYGVTQTREKGFTSTTASGFDPDGIGPANGFVVAGQYYPQQVNFLEVPTSAGVKITTWANLNNHRWTLTTVRNLIADYELKHEGWTVVAAINGDFFDISGSGYLPYQTSGAIVSDGNNYKTTSGGTVAFTNDGTANSLIGNQAVTRAQYLKLAVYDANGAIVSEFDVQKVNAAPGDNETAVYFANYDATKTIVPVDVIVSPTSNGYFVDAAELALPNRPNDFYGKGAISSFASKTIAKGQFAIVTNNLDVAHSLGSGVTIRVQYEYTGAFAGVNDVCGGGATIMRNGALDAADDRNRHPRTVVGKRADGTVVMMVVDGRQSNIDMYGATYPELAAIMASRGCVDAYNLDGGGSSTMVIREGENLRVLNSPSDGRERTDSNCILIVTREPEMEYELLEKTETSLSFKLNILEAYTHKIDKVLVRVNAQTQEVVDGEVTFTGLRPNKEYKVDVYYKTPSGVIYTMTFFDYKTTMKRAPEFFIVNLTESQTSYTFEPEFFDLDIATNLLIAKLYVNETEYTFVDGLLTLEKAAITSLDSVRLVYTVDIGNGPIEIIINNPHFYSTMALNEIIDGQKAFVSGLYK